MISFFKRLLRIPYSFIRYYYSRYIKESLFSNVEVNNDYVLRKVSSFKESFYGYFNLPPDNDKGMILYCVPHRNRKSVDICIKTDIGELIIGNTKAFNWQQGAMEQWGRKNHNLIYYNYFDSKNNNYETVIYDIHKKQEIDRLPLPIYSISPNEDYALSLNFERLAKMRPDYGYFCRRKYSLPPDSQDGIWRIDISTHTVNLIISIEQLKHISPVPSMSGASHKVNHIDISPSGTRFMFLHRWVGPMGRFMRLYTANADGTNLNLLNGDKMTSHSYWISDEQIVSYCFTEKYGNAYVVFDDKTNRVFKLPGDLPKEDGHPSTYSKIMVTDTYPGHDRISKLFLYNLDDTMVFQLGRFYQPLKYTGTKRIDLHPKWGEKGDIFIESGHDGYRSLYMISKR